MTKLFALPARIAAAALLVALVAAPTQADFVISTASGLFEPSFRGDAGSNWFGYSTGTFFGTPVPPSASRILNNTAPTLGNVGLADGVEFYQNDRNDAPFVGIGASSGNLYTGQGPIGKTAAATMVVPTAGTPGSGFTTIILQGYTNVAGGQGVDTLIGNYGRLSINGAQPTEWVIGGNAENRGQWWARFDLLGNQADYTIDWNFIGGVGTTPVSIAELTVDSFWSASGFAPDTAVAVPEPSSLVLLGCGIAGVYFLRRRARKA